MSAAESLPSWLETNRWSSVNNLNLTFDGVGSPALTKSVTAQSNGQGALAADVIIAITECPAAVLKLWASDKTRAGLNLLALRSVKGNGTRTTANRSNGNSVATGQQLQRFL